MLLYRSRVLLHMLVLCLPKLSVSVSFTPAAPSRPNMLSSTVLSLRVSSKGYLGLLPVSRWSVGSQRHYAKPAIAGIAGLGKKKLGKAGPMLEKKVLPVETDPVKLVTYCCGSNLNKEGEDIKLKDDSEYPDWLWTINTGPPIPLEQMDPDTEEYWERVKALANKRSTSLLRLKKF